MRIRTVLCSISLLHLRTECLHYQFSSLGCGLKRKSAFFTFQTHLNQSLSSESTIISSKNHHSKTGFVTDPPIALVASWIKKAGMTGNYKKALTYLKKQLECVKHENDDTRVDLVKLYNAALLAVGRSGKWKLALSMLHDMKKVYNLTPDVFTYSNAMDACMRAKRSNEVYNLFIHMRATDIPRDVVVYTIVLKSFGDDPSCDVADRIENLTDLMNKDGISPNARFFAAAITVYALSSHWEAAVNLLETMELNHGIKPSFQAWEAAIHACDRGFAWEQSIRLLHMMPNPTLAAYNSAMSACSRAGHWNEAIALMAELRKSGFNPDVITYNTLITALGRGKQWESALDVFDRMSVAPNTNSFNSALTACSISKKWQVGLEIFAEMGSNSGQTRPDLVTYNVVIAMLAKARQGQRALGIFEEMQAMKYKPDGITFASAALACERNSPPLYRRAFDLLKDMKLAGVTPAIGTYSSILSAVSRAGQIDLALHLLEKMESDGLPPNEACLQNVLSACEKAKRSDSAYAIFQKMKSQAGPDWGPNGDSAYTTVVRAFQKNGQWTRAFELLSELRMEPWCTSNYDQWYAALKLLVEDDSLSDNFLLGKAHPRKTYLAALAGAAQGGRWEECLALLGRMEKQGLNPGSVGYGAVLEALATAGEHEKGLQLFDIIQTGIGGVHPDILCYMAAMRCCKEANDWSRALKLLRDSENSGFYPPRRMRLDAACIFRKAGQFEELWKLRKNGNKSLFLEVIYGCIAAGRSDRIMVLLEEIRIGPATLAHSIWHDPKIHTASIEGLSNLNETALADFVLNQAVDSGVLLDPVGSLPVVNLSNYGPGYSSACIRYVLSYLKQRGGKNVNVGSGGLVLVANRGESGAISGAIRELEKYNPALKAERIRHSRGFCLLISQTQIDFCLQERTE